MGKLVAFENVTLDGDKHAPGRPDEDSRDGFEHGGWAAPYADAVVMGLASEGASTTDAMLFGRRTYEDFASFWPLLSGNQFTELLNATTKYVASTTLRESLPRELIAAVWSHPREGPRAQGEPRPRSPCPRHRRAPQIAGAARTPRHVHAADPSHRPGKGQRLFGAGQPRAAFELVDTKASTSGVIVATYALGG